LKGFSQHCVDIRGLHRPYVTRVLPDSSRVPESIFSRRRQSPFLGIHLHPAAVAVFAFLAFLLLPAVFREQSIKIIFCLFD